MKACASDGVGEGVRGGSKMEQFRIRILKRELSLLDTYSKSGAERARILQYEIDVAENGAIRDSQANRGGYGIQQEPDETCSVALGIDSEVSTAMAAGHALHISGNIMWCTRCGGLTAGKKPWKLKQDCVSAPMSNYTRCRLRKLESVSHPYSQSPMEGMTRKVRIADLSYRDNDRGGPFKRNVQSTRHLYSSAWC